jgi:hypothetical protein
MPGMRHLSLARQNNAAACSAFLTPTKRRRSAATPHPRADVRWRPLAPACAKRIANPITRAVFWCLGGGCGDRAAVVHTLPRTIDPPACGVAAGSPIWRFTARLHGGARRAVVLCLLLWLAASRPLAVHLEPPSPSHGGCSGGSR